MPRWDKRLLRKNSPIETVIDQFGNIFPFEYTRHRSTTNCQVNILAGSVAYPHQPKTPSPPLTPEEIQDVECLTDAQLLVD